MLAGIFAHLTRAKKRILYEKQIFEQNPLKLIGKNYTVNVYLFVVAGVGIEPTTSGL